MKSFNFKEKKFNSGPIIEKFSIKPGEIERICVLSFKPEYAKLTATHFDEGGLGKFECLGADTEERGMCCDLLEKKGTSNYILPIIKYAKKDDGRVSTTNYSFEALWLSEQSGNALQTELQSEGVDFNDNWETCWVPPSDSIDIDDTSTKDVVVRFFDLKVTGQEIAKTGKFKDYARPVFSVITNNSVLSVLLRNATFKEELKAFLEKYKENISAVVGKTFESEEEFLSEYTKVREAKKRLEDEKEALKSIDETSLPEPKLITSINDSIDEIDIDNIDLDELYA